MIHGLAAGRSPSQAELLAAYRYLGNGSDRTNNSNIDEELLAAHLVQSGYMLDQIGRAIHLLRVEAENPNRNSFFHWLTCTGCSSFSSAIVPTGFTPRAASMAMRALNSALKRPLVLFFVVLVDSHQPEHLLKLI